MLVQQAYDTNDLATLTIYIRIELRRNRHTIDADRCLFLSPLLFSFICCFFDQHTQRYSLFCLYVSRAASFDATNGARHNIEWVLYSCHLVFVYPYITTEKNWWWKQRKRNVLSAVSWHCFLYTLVFLLNKTKEYIYDVAICSSNVKQVLSTYMSFSYYNKKVWHSLKRLYKRLTMERRVLGFFYYEKNQHQCIYLWI
jgi:hypothetical protein